MDDNDDIDDDLPPALDPIAAHAMAAALCDGAWEPRAMQTRLDSTVEPRARDREEAFARAWLVSMVEGAQSGFSSAPPVQELARWIAQHSRVEGLARFRVLRFPTPAPEMRESRWSVPALATTRELAMWLGVSIEALDAWTRHIADAPPPRKGHLADAAPREGVRPLDAFRVQPADNEDHVRARHIPDAPNVSERVLHYRYEWIAEARHSDVRARHYRYRWIAKAHGYRLLEAPKPRLRAVQRDLLDGIIARIDPHDAAFGFRAGRSVVDFAARHVGRDTVIRMDLKAFFTSVFAPRVAGILRTAGYPDRVARTIAAICTHRTPPDVVTRELDPLQRARLRAPHLPQGAPTSGALANLAAYRLDVRVAAFAERVGATYGRYADDLVLSGDRALAKSAPSIIARIGAIAIDEGFALNFRKTRVMTAADQQRIAGIVVNAKPAMQRAELGRLRAIVHNCLRTEPATQNREGVADFRAHLRGRIAWVSSLDPAKGARLRTLFDSIRWETETSA